MKKAKTTLPRQNDSALPITAQHLANLKSQFVTSHVGAPPAIPLPTNWHERRIGDADRFAGYDAPILYLPVGIGLVQKEGRV
ncbi:MAG: hypothetical protein WCS01_06480 [bacterium]